MLSRKDLVLINHTSKTERLLAAQSIPQLISLVKHWFNVPALRPTNKSAQFSIYKELQSTKAKVVERIIKDWPRGFYSVQIAQLEIRAIISKEKTRTWQVGRILTESGKLRLDLDAASIKESIEDFISQYLSCYLYVLHHKESDLYWLRIEIYPKVSNSSLSLHETTYVIFYPQTEFVIFSGHKISRALRTYIRQAILKTYNGEKIDVQRHQGEIVHQITSVIRTRRSQGVFAPLRHNQADSNPLDIRQKAPIRLEHEEEPANTSDLDRRIKDVDDYEVKFRRKLAFENFGYGHINSTKLLRADIIVPLNATPVDENREEEIESLPSIKFKLKMRGSNIAKGVNNMMQAGRIHRDAPTWLKTIGLTGATRLYVTKEGASEVPPDEEDEDASSMDEDERTYGTDQGEQTDGMEEDRVDSMSEKM